MFDKFDHFNLTLNGARISGRVSHQDGCSKPPLLLLHGHPETHVMWHRIADRLAEHYTVVAPDLRGYGQSHAPEVIEPTRSSRSNPDRPPPEPAQEAHYAHSKRAMAEDQILLMEHFGSQRGFEHFAVCAHDRGARVAARLLADHPGKVSAAILLDIAPTLDMYQATDRSFATAYFHWFFLIQPAPLPEDLIAANPRAYVENLMGGRHAGLGPFPPDVLNQYVAALSQPGGPHTMCEDYRASAGVDLEHDREDREHNRLITTPLRVLWGRHGVIEKLFDPLALWSAVAPGVTGRALDSGHYVPEEAPDEVFAEILDFL